MNEINIISSDARYVALNEMFLENGYRSRICTYDRVERANILILPIKCALADEDFSEIFLNLDKSAIVFSGQPERVRRYFDGKIIDYSADEGFLDKNAYITAECAVSMALNDLQSTVSEIKCAVIGYGRIGRYLSKMLGSLGSSVTVLARREESRSRARKDGFYATEIQQFQNERFDVVFNTVPVQIISKRVSDRISDKALVYDLASLPGGFEDESFPKRALALPGKMKPLSAGKAIFDFVVSCIPNERN